MEERLQKILARAGYGSRRANEELIAAGRVRVNNQVAILGTKADLEKDTVMVDGTVIGKKMPEFAYIALHKPRGILSDEDPRDSRPTVRDLVPISGHLFAVGRLDMDSEGLMLLTNDGELANHLTHPRYEHEKEYRVLIASRPDEEQMNTWRRGVVLEDGYRTAPAIVSVEGLSGKGTWLRIIMKEGKKRQIREVAKRIGLFVVRIVRIRIGTLELGFLKPREWRHLTPGEVISLREGRPQKTENPVRPQGRGTRPLHRTSSGHPRPATGGRGPGSGPRVGSGTPTRVSGSTGSNEPAGRRSKSNPSTGRAGEAPESNDQPGRRWKPATSRPGSSPFPTQTAPSRARRRSQINTSKGKPAARKNPNR